MKGFLLCLVLVSYLNVEATADEDVFRDPELVPIPRLDVCRIDGQIYLDGEKFINKACTGYCTCHADASGHGFSCVSLCPPAFIRCPPGKKVEEYKVPVSAECYCKRSRCVLDSGLPA